MAKPTVKLVNGVWFPAFISPYTGLPVVYRCVDVCETKAEAMAIAERLSKPVANRLPVPSTARYTDIANARKEILGLRFSGFRTKDEGYARQPKRFRMQSVRATPSGLRN